VERPVARYIVLGFAEKFRAAGAARLREAGYLETVYFVYSTTASAALLQTSPKAVGKMLK